MATVSLVLSLSGEAAAQVTLPGPDPARTEAACMLGPLTTSDATLTTGLDVAAGVHVRVGRTLWARLQVGRSHWTPSADRRDALGFDGVTARRASIGLAGTSPDFETLRLRPYWLANVGLYRYGFGGSGAEPFTKFGVSGGFGLEVLLGEGRAAVVTELQIGNASAAPPIAAASLFTAGVSVGAKVRFF